MIVRREIIKIDEDKCDGCGQCVPNCAEGSLVIIDGKAKMVADKYCDGLGACLGHCPQGALTIEVREADEYDHDAVEDLLSRPLAEREAMAAGGGVPRSGGCPSAAIQTMTPCQVANVPQAQQGSSKGAQLSHWPVQLRLVPPEASFLKGADLLLAADCTAVALPDFHHKYVAGRVVLLGCPKFDDVEAYLEKLTAIFAGCGLKSVTVLEMEVPCCSTMHRLVHEARKRSGADFSVDLKVVSRTGDILVGGPAEGGLV